MRDETVGTDAVVFGVVLAGAAVVAMMLLNGCGAAEVEEETEVGQAYEGLIFAPAGATQPGMQPTTFNACFQGVQNQFCVVPSQKDFVYFFASGTETQKSVWEGVIAQTRDKLIAAGMQQCTSNGCWHFRRATNTFDPDITVRIILNNQYSQSTGLPISACSGSSGTVRTLYCYDGPTRSLVKNTPLSGTYATWNYDGDSTPSLAVDANEIDSNVLLTSAQKQNRRLQVAGMFVLNFMGEGAVGINNNRCRHYELLNPNVNCVMSAADACLANGFGGEEDQDGIQILGADCGT